MDIDDKITRAKELIAEREAIDAQLADLFAGGSAPEKKQQSCGKCGSTSHNARTCPQPVNGQAIT